MIKADIGRDIGIARQILEEGDLVGIPTETVYGLAASAFDEKAAIKIFQVKNRPAFDPLIVHTNSVDRIREFVSEIPEAALGLFQRFSPGPLTVLLKRSNKIPDLVTSGSPLVAVRIPNHPLTLDLLSQLDFPVAAPSANPFGYVSPTSAFHVLDQLGTKIRYILDGGPANVGIESTIVGFEKEEPVVYRLGGVSIEDLDRQLGKLKLNLINNSQPASPGMLTSHYAPAKEVILAGVEDALRRYHPGEIGAIVFKDYLVGIPKEQQIVLSKDGDLQEAARNLFSALRKLDELPVKVVIAETVPDVDLGRAINDRLGRAAARRTPGHE